VDRHAMLDLNDVVQHPGRTVEFEVCIEALDDPDVALTSPIDGVLKARSDGSVLRLWGDFGAGFAMECDRCGADFDLPVGLAVDEAFPLRGTPTAFKGPGATVDDEEEPYRLFEQNRLRIDDLLRQLFLVALPMHPVCSPDCKGLCERCGKNLNEGPCGCADEAGHPSFRKLAAEWSEPKQTV
jgi:uncharacterized protein